MDDWMAQFRAEIIALAKENYRLLDGTTDPIKQIVRDNEIVFGVFPDPSSEDGAGLCIIKGNKRLASIAGGGSAPDGSFPLFGPSGAQKVKIGAIPCGDYEQAVAARKVFGDNASS